MAFYVNISHLKGHFPNRNLSINHSLLPPCRLLSIKIPGNLSLKLQERKSEKAKNGEEGKVNRLSRDLRNLHHYGGALVAGRRHGIRGSLRDRLLSDGNAVGLIEDLRRLGWGVLER